jgi:hypothetical protein
MRTYSQFRFWSPYLGCEAVRLSMFDSHGGEFFKIISADNAKTFRKVRDIVVNKLAAAIDNGDQPGEVHIGEVSINDTVLLV